MTAPRLFCTGPLAAGDYLLPDAAAHHAARVLRLSAGDPLVLFDGAGGEWPARIVSIARDAVRVNVEAHASVERESPLAVTLVQALQAADKMDYTVQKAVELGVSRIVPVEARRSVVRLDGARADKRVQHWRQVAVAACEQCGRNRVPEIASILPLERALSGLPAADGALRLTLDPRAGRALAAMPRPAAATLLIGPEGGFDERELMLADAHAFAGVRLGPRVLRTETAGLAAMAAMQALWGDFN